MKFWNIIATFQINTLEFFKIQSFIEDKKLKPKTAYLGVFKREFEKTIAAIDASTLQFIKMSSFAENQKTSNLELKMS